MTIPSSWRGNPHALSARYVALQTGSKGLGLRGNEVAYYPSPSLLGRLGRILAEFAVIFAAVVVMCWWVSR